MEERDRIDPGPRGHGGADDRSWNWLLADGACPICGQRHSPWIRRFAAWLGAREAA